MAGIPTVALTVLAVLTGASRVAFSDAAVLHPVSTIRLSGTAASGLALGNDRLWVTHYEASFLSQVDPLLDQETATLTIEPWAASISNVGGSLWILHFTGDPESARLTVLDPASGAIALGISVPALCCEMAGAAGKVWGVDPRGTLLALDPTTGLLVSTTPVTLAPNVHVGLVADEWAVWLSSDTTPLPQGGPSHGRRGSRNRVRRWDPDDDRAWSGVGRESASHLGDRAAHR